ncbi:hypothetical protein ACFWGC_27675 [Cytobacillus pseudoceanisediminis]|uniref:hypothetical protein n=1 Tax=Cytobacillus pseudoceanisediminis TaxID=3051614 RepID=UPI0036561534
MSFNPMFSNKKTTQKVTENASNVRILGGDKPKKERKVRSDKKFDIKVPLTEKQRILIRRLAKSNDMYPTHYCEYLVKKGLSRKVPVPKEKSEYPSSSPLSFHVRLEERFLEKLDEFCIQWDCSRKKAAYRILMGMINAEGESLYGRTF